MATVLSISPHGRPRLEHTEEEPTPRMGAAAESRIHDGFAASVACGLLHLATVELRTALPASLAFGREVARRYLTRLCQTPDLDSALELPPIVPTPEELSHLVEQAPPMMGSEYLTTDALMDWWTELDGHVREEIRRHAGGAGAYLRGKCEAWHLVGRVTFHLAENKRNDLYPFGFLATYAHRMSEQGVVQHLPLSRALKEYSGAANRDTLVSLLTPISQTAKQCAWIAALVESGAIYQALAWTPRQAHQFLLDAPTMKAGGLVVRVPDWWKSARPPRPQVSVRIGNAAKSGLGAEALLDFSVNVTLDGQAVDKEELSQLLASQGGLVRLRGQWVDVDREKLAAALEHWKGVEQEAREGGISFFEGMRLLSGAAIGEQAEEDAAARSVGAEQMREWAGIAPGEWLSRTLAELRNPAGQGDGEPPRALQAKLRPYQQTGVHWLRFLTRLGLGACLADDMGLGKTIQVLSLLLHARETADAQRPPAADGPRTSLLVVPASLIANWRSEIARFAPTLAVWVAHPSETDQRLSDEQTLRAAVLGRDLVITTYGMLARLETLRSLPWNLVILDEAQAIKNAGTRQARAVKQVRSAGRVAMTGTPIENRLSDLWSLFDFLNPGLLGSSKAFARYVKSIERQEGNEGEEGAGYAPLRALVRPYILRRLKTDKRIIADLPEKTEVTAFCGLSKRQASLYAQAVGELADNIQRADGIQRRGIVLASLMRLKQICNHPSQWLGDAEYSPQDSGKFHRLAELCEELAGRQQRALIFTQFREIASPLADFLGRLFGRPGLVLHGGVAVAKRRSMVEAFQRDDGPPFFVLSLKAGGAGLNLTAASHVIHFDRWWNPAVENQATDRAFRIGQKQSVMVHKFVCRGTLEEKIDRMIAEKAGLTQDLLDSGAERLLTEMDDRQLLRFVSLDITKAADE